MTGSLREQRRQEFFGLCDQLNHVPSAGEMRQAKLDPNSFAFYYGSFDQAQDSLGEEWRNARRQSKEETSSQTEPAPTQLFYDYEELTIMRILMQMWDQDGRMPSWSEVRKDPLLKTRVTNYYGYWQQAEKRLAKTREAWLAGGHQFDTKGLIFKTDGPVGRILEVDLQNPDDGFTDSDHVTKLWAPYPLALLAEVDGEPYIVQLTLRK